MKRFFAILVILLTVGCTESGIKNITTWGSSGQIKFYSGGKLINEWTSTGKICSEAETDGWRFVDKKTGKLIRITGDVIIEN